MYGSQMSFAFRVEPVNKQGSQKDGYDSMMVSSHTMPHTFDLKQREEFGLKSKFGWVKSHVGIRGNEEADRRQPCPPNGGRGMSTRLRKEASSRLGRRQGK